MMCVWWFSVAAPPPTRPIQVLYPKRGVSMLRWHPDASAELAVAFTHFNQVYVYDLEAWSSEPTRVYQVGHRAKGSAGGNICLTFARHPPARGGGCFMVTGSTYGMLRCWDMRRTERLYWEVKLRSSQGTFTLHM
jgi:WD40 repeat protein